MQVKGSSTAPVSDSIVVLPDLPTGHTDVTQLRDPATGLTFGQISYAINVSDMPTLRPVGIVEDPAVYIAQGLARLGAAELQAKSDESSRLARLKYVADKATRRAANASWGQMWGGPDRARRFDRAHSLAERYWRTTSIYRDLAVTLAGVA